MLKEEDITQKLLRKPVEPSRITIVQIYKKNGEWIFFSLNCYSNFHLKKCLKCVSFFQSIQVYFFFKKNIFL